MRKPTRRRLPTEPPPAKRHAVRRKKNRPRSPVEVRRTRGKMLTALYILLVGVSVAALLTSPKLSVKRVQIQGATGLPTAEAQAVAQAAFIPAGVNTFLAPTGKLEAKLRALPCVRQASVSRHFPDGLEAKIALRQPVAIAQTSAGDFEVDRSGFAIRAARMEKMANLPHIALLRPRTVQVGVSLNDTALDAALEALDRAANEPALRIAKIEVDLTDNLCLNMHDGIKARLGSPEDIPKKMALLSVAYQREPNLAARLLAINLSCPDWPACTPRKSVAAPASGTPPAGTPG